jgi:hypothetical protein
LRSIYERVLGSEFNNLHPKIQERFGFCSRDGKAAVGTGTMHRVWHGASYTLPFLRLGAWRNIMFPEMARDISFTIENYAYQDSFGRDTLTWVRTFETKRRRRFDAYMIYSEARNVVVDYLGTHQHLAVELHLKVDPATRGMRLRSGEQRFYEGKLAFRFPMFFSGIADVLEWYDDDLGRYRISVEINNHYWGPLFGYEGEFDVNWIPNDALPCHLQPKREEIRD